MLERERFHTALAQLTWRILSLLSDEWLQGVDGELTRRMSYAQIAVELNNRGLKTRTGTRWHTTNVQNILKR